MNIRARTEEDKLQKKQMILRAARDLFFKHGYYGTTIEMITEKAGVSTGTFYLYYRNKIEIYKALQDEGLDILIEMIDQVISWPGMSALAKLADISRTYLRYFNDYREYFDIMAVLSATPDELKETETEISRIIDGKTIELLKSIEKVIGEGIENGELIEIDTWKATSILWGMMDGLILLAERHNIENVIGVGLEELVKQMLEIVFFGMVKDKGITHNSDY